jgi:hypothetical protein
MQTLKNIIFMAIALALSVFLVWSAFDIGMSVAGKLPATTMSLETEYLDGRGWALRRGHQLGYSFTSSESLRRYGTLPSLVPDEKRILFLGESTCFSYYVMQEQDWPTVVEKELRALGVPVTTMNGGVPGYAMKNVRFSYPWFKERLPVDIVVVYEAWNDYFHEPNTSFDPDFDFEVIAKKIFKDWPESLEPSPNYEKYIFPPPPRSPALSFKLFNPLQHLISSSPLANYIFSSLLSKIPQRWIGNNSGKLPLASSSETYMFHLGSLISEAERDATQVVIVRPFSVFRMKTFDNPKKEKMLLSHGLKLGDEGMIRQMIIQMDQIADKFSTRESVTVIDPTRGMLEKVSQENAYEGGYNSYMHGTPHHTGARGDRLLGRVVAGELINAGLVNPITDAPWNHPLEKKSDDNDFTYRVVSLESFNINRVLLAFLVAMVFSLIGAMLLIVMSGVDRFDNIFGWSMALGSGIILSLLICLHQIVSNPLMCLGVSVILLLAILVRILFKGRTFMELGRRIFVKTVLSGLAAFVLLFAASEINIKKLQTSNPTSNRMIREYLAWMDFQTLHSLFESGQITYTRVHKKLAGDGITKGDAIPRPLDILLPLVQRSDYYAHVSPLLASALAMVVGGRPENAFLVMLGLPSTILSLPVLMFLFRWRELTPGERGIGLFLFATCFYVGSNILMPVAQYGVIGIVCMVLAVYLKGNEFCRGLVFCLSAGMVILVPDPAILILILGIALTWGMENSFGKNNRAGIGDILPLFVLAIVLVIAGKSLMLDYPAAHLPIFEFLEKRNLILSPTLSSPIKWGNYVFIVSFAGYLGYLLIGRSSAVIAIVSLASILLAFYLLPDAFKAIPLVATMVIVYAMLTEKILVLSKIHKKINLD